MLRAWGIISIAHIAFSKISLPPQNIDNPEGRPSIDAGLPNKLHETCTNACWTINSKDAWFYIHLFIRFSVIFMEEKWLKVLADSRNFICNRFGLGIKSIIVLPLRWGDDKKYDDSNRFSDGTWRHIKGPVHYLLFGINLLARDSQGTSREI